MKLKKGDKVMVIAGKARGTTGTIVRALPQKDLVVIEGVNMVKKHRRANQQNRSGQIVEKAMPIHVSNVQILDPKGGKPTRIRITRGEGGARQRITTKSGTQLT